MSSWFVNKRRDKQLKWYTRGSVRSSLVTERITSPGWGRTRGWWSRAFPATLILDRTRRGSAQTGIRCVRCPVLSPPREPRRSFVLLPPTENPDNGCRLGFHCCSLYPTNIWQVSSSPCFSCHILRRWWWSYHHFGGGWFMKLIHAKQSGIHSTHMMHNILYAYLWKKWTLENHLMSLQTLQ